MNLEGEKEIPPRALILGAGPSGLGVALGTTLNSTDCEITIVEKGSRVGGLSGSFDWGGHRIDFGPHRISPNIAIIRQLVENLLGPDCLVQKSQHGVQFRGKLYQFPPRLVDWLDLRSLYWLARFGLSFLGAKLRWIVGRFEADSFRTIIDRKFGTLFFHEIVSPICEKIWTRAEAIDPSFATQRFAVIAPLAALKAIFLPRQELNPSTFYYPRKGFQQLWDEAARYLVNDEASVLLDTSPSRILVENNLITEVTLRGPEGEERIDTQGQTVVSTIPLTTLVNLLEGIDSQSLRTECAKIQFRSMALVCLEIDGESALPYRTLIYPEARFCFNRIFEQNKYSRDTVTAGKSVIVADVTVPLGDPFLRLSDDEIAERVMRDMKSLRYLPLERVTAKKVVRVEHAYVVPDLVSRQAYHQVLQELGRIRNLLVLGRFGVGEYDNSDYAVDNGLVAGAMLSRKISRFEYLERMAKNRGRRIVG